MTVRRVFCEKNVGVKSLGKRTQKRDKDKGWWWYKTNFLDRKCLDMLVK